MAKKVNQEGQEKSNEEQRSNEETCKQEIRNDQSPKRSFDNYRSDYEIAYGIGVNEPNPDPNSREQAVTQVRQETPNGLSDECTSYSFTHNSEACDSEVSDIVENCSHGISPKLSSTDEDQTTEFQPNMSVKLSRTNSLTDYAYSYSFFSNSDNSETTPIAEAALLTIAQYFFEAFSVCSPIE
uniref:Uncharacterized protein n=1 Tax=Corethron hystrix TaxID=216773 RepID=A0A7S1BVP6_9STRA|mmetsp:Transcript_40445/g.95023  ORF Transcript_40445/g.95023 Transcript_40445/m.95023 type:complete len:183 (+) Transcript_40445:245-793(+)